MIRSRRAPDSSTWPSSDVWLHGVAPFLRTEELARLDCVDRSMHATLSGRRKSLFATIRGRKAEFLDHERRRRWFFGIKACVWTLKRFNAYMLRLYYVLIPLAGLSMSLLSFLSRVKLFQPVQVTRSPCCAVPPPPPVAAVCAGEVAVVELRFAAIWLFQLTVFVPLLTAFLVARVMFEAPIWEVPVVLPACFFALRAYFQFVLGSAPLSFMPSLVPELSLAQVEALTCRARWLCDFFMWAFGNNAKERLWHLHRADNWWNNGLAVWIVLTVIMVALAWGAQVLGTTLVKQLAATNFALMLTYVLDQFVYESDSHDHVLHLVAFMPCFAAWGVLFLKYSLATPRELPGFHELAHDWRVYKEFVCGLVVPQPFPASIAEVDWT